MKVPFSGWTLSDIWETISTKPELVKTGVRRGIRGFSPHSIDLDKGWFVCLECSGASPIDSALMGASLWSPDSPEPLAIMDEQGCSWTRSAPSHFLEVNEVCWPYSLITDQNVWCVTDQSTTKLFMAGYRYKDLQPLTPQIQGALADFDTLITDYVNNIGDLPEINLCAQCDVKATRHLIEHIVRGECNQPLLRGLIGYRGGELSVAQQELLKYTLRYTLGSLLMEGITFALPNRVATWMRSNLAWPTVMYDSD